MSYSRQGARRFSNNRARCHPVRSIRNRRYTSHQNDCRYRPNDEIYHYESSRISDRRQSMHRFYNDRMDPYDVDCGEFDRFEQPYDENRYRCNYNPSRSEFGLGTDFCNQSYDMDNSVDCYNYDDSRDYNSNGPTGGYEYDPSSFQTGNASTSYDRFDECSKHIDYPGHKRAFPDPSFARGGKLPRFTDNYPKSLMDTQFDEEFIHNQENFHGDENNGQDLLSTGNAFSGHEKCFRNKLISGSRNTRTSRFVSDRGQMRRGYNRFGGNRASPFFSNHEAARHDFDPICNDMNMSGATSDYGDMRYRSIEHLPVRNITNNFSRSVLNRRSFNRGSVSRKASRFSSKYSGFRRKLDDFTSRHEFSRNAPSSVPDYNNRRFDCEQAAPNRGDKCDLISDYADPSMPKFIPGRGDQRYMPDECGTAGVSITSDYETTQHTARDMSTSGFDYDDRMNTCDFDRNFDIRGEDAAKDECFSGDIDYNIYASYGRDFEGRRNNNPVQPVSSESLDPSYVETYSENQHDKNLSAINYTEDRKRNFSAKPVVKPQRNVDFPATLPDSYKEKSVRFSKPKILGDNVLDEHEKAASQRSVQRFEYGHGKSNIYEASCAPSISLNQSSVISQKPPFPENPPVPLHVTINVDELLKPPGRLNRPPRIFVVLRGLPGSGKSYLASLISAEEEKQKNSKVKIFSIDAYFIVEHEKDAVNPDNGRKMKKVFMEYEFDVSMENSYLQSLSKSLIKAFECDLYDFIIMDSVNDKITHFSDVAMRAVQKGFKVYVIEMNTDMPTCLSRNIHNRSVEDLENIKRGWESLPLSYVKLNVNSLLQEDAIIEVEMDDAFEESSQNEPEISESASVVDVGKQDLSETEDDGGLIVSEEPQKSKWELMELSETKLDRLDGLKRMNQVHHTKHPEISSLFSDDSVTEDYYTRESVPGNKRVRWADLEEKKQQLKRRALGFVVGQSSEDWYKMSEDYDPSTALHQYKYI